MGEEGKVKKWRVKEKQRVEREGYVLLGVQYEQKRIMSFFQLLGYNLGYLIFLFLLSGKQGLMLYYLWVSVGGFQLIVLLQLG